MTSRKYIPIEYSSDSETESDEFQEHDTYSESEICCDDGPNSIEKTDSEVSEESEESEEETTFKPGKGLHRSRSLETIPPLIDSQDEEDFSCPESDTELE